MNPLPWIQLAVSLLAPLIVMAVAWGRLTERDTARSGVDQRILDGIKELNGKFDDLRVKTASHDTDLAVLESSLTTLRSEIAAMKTTIDSNVATDRNLRHEMRGEFQKLINELSGRFEQFASQPPPPPRRR